MIDAALVVARAFHFAATLLLEGGMVFWLVVERPLLDRGASRDRFDLTTRLTTTLAAAWIIALLSGAAWLFLLAGQIAGLPPMTALRQGTDWLLLLDTQFGAVWQWRAAGLLALAILLVAMRAMSEPSRPCAVLAALIGMGLAGSLAWSGHGGATLGAAGAMHIAADVVHVIAAGVWLGGLLPFGLLLRAAGDAARGIDLRAMTRRFSSLALASVLLLLVTGIVNGWFLVGSISALATTFYGRVLLGKIALFLLMLAFAAVNRIVLTPQLAGKADVFESAKTRLTIHAGCELALGAAILVIVGLLGTLSPPAHSPHGTALHAVAFP